MVQSNHAGNGSTVNVSIPRRVNGGMDIVNGEGGGGRHRCHRDDVFSLPNGLRPVELSTPLLLAALADADLEDRLSTTDCGSANQFHRSRHGAFPQPASPAQSMSSDGSVSWLDMDELMRSSEYAGLPGAEN